MSEIVENKWWLNENNGSGLMLQHGHTQIALIISGSGNRSIALFDGKTIVECCNANFDLAEKIQRLTTALENARKDALEEAAQICDKQEIYSRKIGEGDEEFWSSHHATAMKTASILAASIRSLTPPKEKAT